MELTIGQLAVLKIAEVITDHSKTSQFLYNRNRLLRTFVTGTTEISAIALTLCGTSGQPMAIRFMNGNLSVVDMFLENVSFNSRQHSSPLIVRALQLHLENRQYIL